MAENLLSVLPNLSSDDCWWVARAMFGINGCMGYYMPAIDKRMELAFLDKSEVKKKLHDLWLECGVCTEGRWPQAMLRRLDGVEDERKPTERFAGVE